MVKRVLMVAFHFPPLRGSSGIQRTLKFTRYLPACGWQPVVLSANPRAYANVGNDQMGDIDSSVVVSRAFALDTSRHLAFRGRYLFSLSLPDRWVSWCLGAVPAGLTLIRKHKPQVLWSTYPIATAHLIGLMLHKLSGLPWVIDMRDPMSDESYPSNPTVRRIYRWIEGKAVKNCSAVVMTTPGTLALYKQRYPDVPASRFVLIENGYDEENFGDAEGLVQAVAPAGSPFRLIHAGIIYPSERDPRPMFDAIAALQQDGTLVPGQFELVLRATGHDDYLATLIAERGIGALVKLAPHIAYREALSEMLNADGLLILQAANCNHQIPAKLYEYLRARRPILALTDPVGDTATTLRKAGIDTIAALDSKQAIQAALADFVARVQNKTIPLPSDAVVQANQRSARAATLATVLDAVAAAHTKRT